MDINIILFTILTFAIILILVRFMIALIFPMLILFGAASLFYFFFLRNRLKIFVANTASRGEGPDLRIEGLSLKYSRIMVETLKKIEAIREAFANDGAIKQIICELDKKFQRLYDELLNLCRKGSQIEQQILSVDYDKLKRQSDEYKSKASCEKDFELKNEYQKNLAMLEEALQTYQHGYKLIKMIDMEVGRAGNYFDIVKLKIANLAMSKSLSPQGGEVEEIYRDLNELFESIEKLKNNFSNINLANSR